MDGVICNFQKRYKELFGHVPERHTNSKEFNDNFSKFIKGNNFATLEMMPDAPMLLDYLKYVRIPIEILSSTAREDSHAEIARQKMIWLDKHNIKYPQNFVPGKTKKQNFADAHSIIIDDTKSIIEQWEKRGGTAILHTDAPTTITILGTLMF
jgi:hypothetical protein